LIGLRLTPDRSWWGRALTTGKWLGKNAGNRHSDKEKFRSDLNRPKSCEMSERLLKTLQKSEDFQAEYEGSIFLTRSDVFSASRERRISF
jgi:hypothetical protein